jgi:hypothetical protein
MKCLISGVMAMPLILVDESQELRCSATGQR